jgi:N,N'-diacetyllegionaminate synthase
MVDRIEFGDRKIGRAEPCFIIAEAGVNHNGSIEMAHQLVDAAVAAGADAVKFQTFKAEDLSIANAPKADYQRRNEDRDESSFEMLKRLELDLDAHTLLMEYCEQKGILFLSTPFDEGSVDLLNDLGVGAFKIPSGEITNTPLLTYIAGKGKPLFVSTGMSYLGDVETAVRTILQAGNQDFVILHCVSSYPADPCDTNLRAMSTMANAFGCPVGYSDHTMGIEVALAAVSLGACVIEKHITLDRNLPGPDHQASIDPKELVRLVRSIRNVEVALGHGRKEPVASEENTAVVSRKSLVAACDIRAGTELSADMIAIKRPGTGLAPSMFPHLLGSRVRRDIAVGELFSLELFL